MSLGGAWNTRLNQQEDGLEERLRQAGLGALVEKGLHEDERGNWESIFAGKGGGKHLERFKPLGGNKIRIRLQDALMGLCESGIDQDVKASEKWQVERGLGLGVRG